MDSQFYNIPPTHLLPFSEGFLKSQNMAFTLGIDNKIMKESFRDQFQNICQRALKNNSDLEELYFRQRMTLPPIFQSRHVLLHGMAQSLSTRHQPSPPKPLEKQKLGVCNITFSKKKELILKPYSLARFGKDKGPNSLLNQSQYHPAAREPVASNKFGHKSTNYQTLRATRPRFCPASLNASNSKKSPSESDIQELMSHFSVGCSGKREDDLILTLQRSKSNFREESEEERKAPKTRKVGMGLNLTIYPHADGIVKRRKKIQAFKEMGRFQPWQLEDREEEGQPPIIRQEPQ